MNRRLLVLTTMLALVALPVVAAEWHTADNNVCTDCHGQGHRLEKRNVRWDKVTRKLLPSTQPASQPASGDKS